MDKKKITYSILFIIFAIIAISVFWKSSLFLSPILVVLFIIKHKVLPIKKEIVWFVISGIIGSLGESLMMLTGPWSYSYTDVINFPAWLPLLWGLAGCVGVSLYQGLSKS